MTTGDDLKTFLAQPALARSNLLDIRSTPEFLTSRLSGAASMPLEPQLASIPAPDQEAWLADHLLSIFLPPRHEPLAVVAAAGDLASMVADHLTKRGRPKVASCGLSPADLATLPTAQLERGASHRTLWQPPPFLVRWAHLLPPPAAGPVLDLACGSGRAAVWLAERGYRVTGIDHQPEALTLARRLANHRGVSLDLHQDDLRLPQSLPEGPWSVVLLFRYLDRDLLARLPKKLRPASLVLLRTFRDAPGYVGNPQPRHRLRRDEATRFWTPDRGRILVHEEGFDADGKPAAGLVFQWKDPAAGR